MAQPERSFGRNFSRLGRLENAWARALAQPDSARALDRLRELYPRFEKVGEAAAPLWLSFQDSVLDARFLPLLQDSDFDRLRAFGERLAAAGDVTLLVTWWPLVLASQARGTAADHERARALLTELYKSPLVSDEVRLYTAATLARLGAAGDAQLAVFADVMTRHPYPPPEVAGLVGRILNVGFDSGDELLRPAYVLAGLLGGPHRRMEVAFALGLGELLLYGRPQVAASHFETAIGYDARHPEALRGLFSAYLHAREFGRAVALGTGAAALSPRCADLLALCQMLAWFDLGWLPIASRFPSDAPPVTTERLSGIVPGRDTGSLRDYALGCSYLLDGDAARARGLLAPLPQAGLSEPDVHYHLAWAHLLCQDPEGVRASYHALAGGPGSWALACLLQDAAPGQALPGPAPLVAGPLTRVAAARRVLIDEGPVPSRVDMQSLAGRGTTQPDLFEALRTALGVAVASNQTSELRTLLKLPYFARLPAAERLIWTALALRTADPERSRLMLRRALASGRDRAALLLAVDALENGRPHEVHELLRGVRGPKAELLMGWADAHNGADVDAVTRFGKLSERGIAQADYAMALLALRDAAREWGRGRTGKARDHAVRASSQLKSAATRSHGRIEVALLDRAARSLASAEGADALRWQDAAEQPWTARLLGLVELIRAPEAADALFINVLRAWARLDAEGAVESPSASVSTPLAQVVLRVVLLAEGAKARREAVRFLIQLDKRSPSPETARAARLAAECVALRTGDGLADPPDDPLLALVGAGVVLARADLTEAVRRLRAVQAVGARPQQWALAAVLADALEGAPLPKPLPFEAPTTVEAALAVATAAGRMAEQDAAGTADTLLRALGSYDMSGLIDLRRVLPHLALQAAKRNRRDPAAAALAPIVRQAAVDADEPGGIGSLAVARYATVAGDYQTADECWRRALERTRSDVDRLDEISREYGRFLCHRAVLADLGGDRATVLTSLRTAADHLPDNAGRVLEDLETDESVAVLLRHLFPDSPILDRQRPGRYPRLAELVEANPGLRRAIESDSRNRIVMEWRGAVERFGRDIELWHTLAVLVREDALARPAGDSAAVRARIDATVLWMLLLAEPGLRGHFARLTLPGETDPLFRKELIEELLVGQKAQFTLAVARGDLDGARLHLHCLQGIARGLSGTRRLLGVGVFAKIAEQAGDEAGFAPIAARAGDLIEEWGAERVAAGERKLNDAAAIRRLARTSPGIDADYESAVRELEVVVLLELPLTKVLRTAVDWHNRWLMCVHEMKQPKAEAAVVRSATPFVDLLVPMCVRGRAHLAENGVLAEYFLWRGVAALDTAPARSIEHFERSLEWSPGFDVVEKLLVRARLDLGMSHFERGDLAKAERVLSQVPEGLQILATRLNNSGVAKLNKSTETMARLVRGRGPIAAAAALRPTLEEAERLLRHAVRLDPGDANIRRNLDEVLEVKRMLRIG